MIQPLYSAAIPQNIPEQESIIIPISMKQPLERGEYLAALVNALLLSQYQKQTTFLICDHLNRHNCTNENEAIEQGTVFLSQHQDMLSNFNIIRWQDFITQKSKDFLIRMKEIQHHNQLEPHFYLKMKKTWEKCLSANQSLESSIAYQMEEYAALLCMNEYDHLFYPKRIY